MRQYARTFIRTTSLLVTLPLILCGIAFAQSNGTDGEVLDRSPHDFRGTWQFTIDVPPQPLSGEMRLGVVGSGLQGRVTTDDGQSYRFRESTVEGSTVSFEIMTRDYGRIKASATLDGETFRGRLSVPGQGVFPWRGEREKEVLSTESRIRYVRESEAARAVVEKHIPGFFSWPGLEYASDYSIRDMATYSGQISGDVLDAIDGELKAL